MPAPMPPLAPPSPGGSGLGRGGNCPLQGAAPLLPLSRPTLAPTPVSCGYPATYHRNLAACERNHPGTAPAHSSPMSSSVSLTPEFFPSALVFSSLFPLRKYAKTKEPGGRNPGLRALQVPSPLLLQLLRYRSLNLAGEIIVIPQTSDPWPGTGWLRQPGPGRWIPPLPGPRWSGRS
jgi:hypothetical protein